MQDEEKRRDQLMEELVRLRRRIAEIEKRASEHFPAEEALTRHQKMLQRIIDQSHTLHAYLDPDFNFVAVNAGYARGSRRTPEELIGRNHFFFYPNAENEAIFKRVKETGEPVSFVDKPFVFPDQPERGVTYWDWTLSPVKDESNRVEGLVLSLIETTARKKREMDLERVRDMLSEAQRIAHLGSFEYDVAAKQAIWSEEEYRIFGLDPGGPPPTFDAMLNCVHPDDVARAQRTFVSAMESKSAYELEYRLVHRDGSVRWAFDRARPCFDEHGKLVRYIGTTLDITARKHVEAELRESHDRLEAAVRERTAELTAANAALRSEIAERKLAEEALQRSEACYHELFNNISSGVAIFDVIGDGGDFIFKDFNRAGELLEGDRREDLIGKSIFEARTGIENFGLLEVFRRVWATGKPESLPAAKYQDHRLNKWYENFVYRLPSGEIAAVFDDVTERHLAEVEIKEKTEHLTEVNAALRALLRQREEDKNEFEESVVSNIKHLIVPYLESLKKSQLTRNQNGWVEALEANLNQMTSTFTRKVTLRELNLSNAELKVSALDRDGKSTKEIAEILLTSEKTVSSHRDSIRSKLGLRGKKGGLRYLLMNLD